MSDTKTPLRKPFQILESGTRGKYSVYRSILNGLGLSTPAALDQLFVQLRQFTKFQVEAVMECPDEPSFNDEDVSCADLPYPNLLVGNQNIAVWDTEEGVLVAHRVGQVIEVYNVGELFLNLLDSRRLDTVKAFVPKFSYSTGYKASSCLNCLNSLLGLGYRVTLNGQDFTTIVVFSADPTVKPFAFDTERLSGLVFQMIEGSLKSDLVNPEWVYSMLQKWSVDHKQLTNSPVNQA